MTKELIKQIDLFISSLIILSFITILGFTLEISKGKSDIGDGLAVNFIADNIKYFTPAIFLCEKLNVENLLVLILLLAVNIVVYAVIVAFVASKLVDKFKSYHPFNATYYSIVTIIIFL